MIERPPSACRRIFRAFGLIQGNSYFTRTSARFIQVGVSVRAAVRSDVAAFRSRRGERRAIHQGHSITRLVWSSLDLVCSIPSKLQAVRRWHRSTGLPKARSAARAEPGSRGLSGTGHGPHRDSPAAHENMKRKWCFFQTRSKTVAPGNSNARPKTQAGVLHDSSEHPAKRCTRARCLAVPQVDGRAHDKGLPPGYGERRLAVVAEKRDRLL